MEQALQYRKASGRSMSSGFLYVVIEQANNLPVSYFVNFIKYVQYFFIYIEWK